MTQDILSVGQLVFARVEPEYSPNNTSGFQFVYRTAELQPTQLEQIKQRVQCFQPYDSDTVRLQFFRLDNGALVLSRSRVIAPWPDFRATVDKKGRTGAFFAHCLVLSEEDLRIAGGNPLAVLIGNAFIEDVPSMIVRFGNAAEFQQRHGRPNGVVPPARIMVTRETRVTRTGWEGDAGRSLLALALQAEALTRQGKSVALIGSQAEVYDALQAALTLVPFEQRLQCSFDTCIDRCMSTPGQYWAIGVKERLGGSAYIDVNTAQRRVPTAVSLITAPDDLYGLWLQDVTEQGSLDQAMSHARTIQLIVRAFKRHAPISSEIAQDLAGCTEFLRVHQVRVDQIIREALATEVGSAALADLVVDTVLTSLSNPVECLDAASQRNFPRLRLAQLLYDRLLAGPINLKDLEWKQLQDVAQREKHYPLLFVAATLGKKVEPKLAALAVNSMDARTFSKLLTNVGDLVSPTLFVSGTHTQDLIDYLIRNSVQLDGAETFELFESLVRAGQAARLDPLIGYLGVLDQSQRQRVEKLIAQQPASAEFRRRLRTMIDSETSPNFLSRLFRRTQRRS